MPLPTPAQIDAAVPVDGTPSRALVNAVLKEVLAAMSYLPGDGTIPTRSVENENFSGGRMKTAVGTDPDDCVNLQQLTFSIPTFSTLAGVPAALTSAQAAGTASIRAIGTTATTAAAGNHSHAVATTSANGFMSSADKSKLDLMPTAGSMLTAASAAPALPGSPGTQGQYFADDDHFYICVAPDSWFRAVLNTWE